MIFNLTLNEQEAAKILDHLAKGSIADNMALYTKIQDDIRTQVQRQQEEAQNSFREQVKQELADTKEDI